MKFAECQKCSQRDSGQASGVLSSPGAQRRWDAQAGLLWSLTMSQAENVFRSASWDCDFCPNASQRRSRVWTDRLKEAHLQGRGQLDLPQPLGLFFILGGDIVATSLQTALGKGVWLRD